MKQGPVFRHVKRQSRHRATILIFTVVIVLFFNACSDYAGETPPKQPDPSLINQGPPTQGKVLNAMRGGGYTYMQLEDQGKTFWIASTVINVRRNDVVSWQGASVMTNFKSASLSRDFDEIYFVSAIKIVN